MGYSTANAEDAAKKAATKTAVKPKLGANRMVYSINELARGAAGKRGNGHRGNLGGRGATGNAAANAAGNFVIDISQLSLLGKRWLAGGMLAGLRAHNITRGH